MAFQGTTGVVVSIDSYNRGAGTVGAQTVVKAADIESCTFQLPNAKVVRVDGLAEVYEFMIKNGKWIMPDMQMVLRTDITSGVPRYRPAPTRSSASRGSRGPDPEHQGRDRVRHEHRVGDPSGHRELRPAEGRGDHEHPQFQARQRNGAHHRRLLGMADPERRWMSGWRPARSSCGGSWFAVFAIAGFLVWLTR